MHSSDKSIFVYNLHLITAAANALSNHVFSSVTCIFSPQLLFDVDECSVVLFQTGDGRKSKSVHMIRGKRAMMKQKMCNRYMRQCSPAQCSSLAPSA
jgi:hypothetical protein